MIPEKIFIVGAKGSGKTEFAHLLSQRLHELSVMALCEDAFLVGECSSVLIGRLAKILAAADVEGDGGPWTGWVKAILRNKDDYRDALGLIGADMAKESPSLLLTEAAALGRIVVGARRREEVNGYYRARGGHGGYGAPGWTAHAWILVDRPGAAAQPDFDEPFFRGQICRYQVFNVTGIDGLKGQAERLAEELCK